MEHYIGLLETLMGRKLSEGWNESVRCMKVTLDPVVSLHRPFIWYLVSEYTHTLLLVCI